MKTTFRTQIIGGKAMTEEGLRGQIEEEIRAYAVMSKAIDLSDNTSDVKNSLKQDQINTTLASIRHLMHQAVPEKEEMVADNLTYGDTKYNSNAVRYGKNQAIDETHANIDKACGEVSK